MGQPHPSKTHQHNNHDGNNDAITKTKERHLSNNNNNTIQKKPNDSFKDNHLTNISEIPLPFEFKNHFECFCNEPIIPFGAKHLFQENDSETIKQQFTNFTSNRKFSFQGNLPSQIKKQNLSWVEEKFPKEVILLVLTFLDGKDLIILGMTNKNFRNFWSIHPLAWFTKVYKNHFLKIACGCQVNHWRDFYLKYYLPYIENLKNNFCIVNRKKTDTEPLKIVIFGQNGIGKSCLIDLFSQQQQRSNSTATTTRHSFMATNTTNSIGSNTLNNQLSLNNNETVNEPINQTNQNLNNNNNNTSTKHFHVRTQLSQDFNRMDHEYMKTIGVEFKVTHLQYKPTNEIARLNLWDTQGDLILQKGSNHFQHQNMIIPILRGCLGILICFDLTDENSLYKVDEYLQFYLQFEFGDNNNSVVNPFLNFTNVKSDGNGSSLNGSSLQNDNLQNNSLRNSGNSLQNKLITIVDDLPSNSTILSKRNSFKGNGIDNNDNSLLNLEKEDCNPFKNLNQMLYEKEKVVCFVGLKSDLINERISDDLIESILGKYLKSVTTFNTQCIQYFECSSKTKELIELPFYFITKQKRRAFEEDNLRTEDDDDIYEKNLNLLSFLIKHTNKTNPVYPYIISNNNEYATILLEDNYYLFKSKEKIEKNNFIGLFPCWNLMSLKRFCKMTFSNHDNFQQSIGDYIVNSHSNVNSFFILQSFSYYDLFHNSLEMLNILIQEQQFRDKKLIIGTNLPLFISKNEKYDMKRKEEDKSIKVYKHYSIVKSDWTEFIYSVWNFLLAASCETKNHDVLIYYLSNIFKEIYKELKLTPKKEQLKKENKFSRDTLYIRNLNSDNDEENIKEEIKNFGNFISFNEIFRKINLNVNALVKCRNEEEAKEMFFNLKGNKPLSCFEDGLIIEFALKGLATKSDLIEFCGEPKEHVEVGT
ncbi:hypothetical protein ABK040_007240 [Willaertia magna]